jgi:hypothetical protein
MLIEFESFVIIDRGLDPRFHVGIHELILQALLSARELFPIPRLIIGERH